MSGSTRFSRNKRRLFPKVSFGDFVQATKELEALVRELRPSSTIKVLTCEDYNTYQFSSVTIYDEEVSQALENRRQYTVESFTQAVWERAFKVQVFFNDPQDPEPFMLTLSFDKAEPRRLVFYSQCEGEDLHNRLLTVFGKPSATYFIGDGHSRMSDFNLEFALKKLRAA